MKIQHILILVMTLLLVGPSLAKETKQDSESLEAKVVSVKGSVHYQLTTDLKDTWKPLKQDDTLNELAVVRMGLGGKLTLQFADRVNLTATGGGKFGIRDFRKQGSKVKANIGLKYGALRLKVDSTVGENDFSVTTPVATLSARGCNCFLSYFPDQGLNFANTHATWVVRTPQGSKTTRNGDKTNQNLASTKKIVSKQLDTQVSDPLGLDSNEAQSLRNNGGGRGIFAFGGLGLNGVSTGGIVVPQSPSSNSNPCPTPSPSPSPSTPSSHSQDSPGMPIIPNDYDGESGM